MGYITLVSVVVEDLLDEIFVGFTLRCVTYPLNSRVNAVFIRGTA